MSFCADLPFGLLAFSGPDAEGFLQGQLSNDLKDLPTGVLQLSSHNSPKGRMLATLLIWRDGESSFRALVSADLAETLRKRLAMYVMRSKVSVLDLSASHALFGVGGAAAGDAVRAALGQAPEPGRVLIGRILDAVALPDGRIVIAAPGEIAESMRNKLAAVATEAPPEYWRWLGIRAGVPVIVAATQDQFVLQAANWDLLGGVSFQKGCYTGQEIIARTQYLGRLKERMHLFHVDGPPPLPGTRLFGAVFGDQACGTVVDAATGPGVRQRSPRRRATVRARRAASRRNAGRGAPGAARVAVFAPVAGRAQSSQAVTAPVAASPPCTSTTSSGMRSRVTPRPRARRSTR